MTIQGHLVILPELVFSFMVVLDLYKDITGVLQISDN